jgi:hypothetical protein
VPAVQTLWRIVATVSVASLAPAQILEELRQAIREQATAVRYSTFISFLASTAADGQLSSGTLTIDTDPKTNLTSISLPIRTETPRGNEGDLLFGEATLGYATAHTRLPDLWGGTLPGLEASVDSRFQCFSGDGGLGVSLPIGAGFHVQPLAHAGLSYTFNDSSFAGNGAALAQAATDGILFNWDATYGSYGGSFAVHNPDIALGEFHLDAIVRYDVRHSFGISIDDPALDTEQNTEWLTARLRFDRETTWSLFGEPIHWLTDIGYRRLLGRAADSIGFADYFELGGGLGLAPKQAIPLLHHVELGAALLLGEDVIGLSIGLSVDF